MSHAFLAFYNGISDSQNTDAMPCFYEAFIKELCEAGNEVFAIHHKKPCTSDWGKIPLSILQEIERFSPNIIFLFNNDFYDLSGYFDCPIVIFEVDSALFYSNQMILKQTANRYKFVVPQMNSIKFLKERFSIKSENILYLPFFTSIRAQPNFPVQSNISFIGSKFSSNKSNFINEFMQNKPSEEEIFDYKRLLATIIENPYKEITATMKKMGIQSKIIQENLSNVNLIQLLSVLSDQRRIAVLEQIADLGLSLYGTSNWVTDVSYCSDLLLSYKNKTVYSLKQNQEIYNSSKICININHVQAKSGFSWRVADVMASNACLVSEYCEDFKVLFPKTPIPKFSNCFEAREVCIKLLRDDALRKDIALQCQEAVEQNCRFRHTAKSLSDFSNVELMCKNPLGREGIKRVTSLAQYESYGMITRLLKKIQKS